MDVELERKKAIALCSLEACGSVIVALSGGVDSALLLALALQALGRERVLAVTGSSASLPECELEAVQQVVRMLGARHERLETKEMDRPGYRANLGDRCFHCRSELFERLGELARERGIARVAYGAIADDLAEVRPGMRAATLAGVVAPLLEAGLHKEDVRRLARAAGIPVADKPAAACLASRIPVGVEVTLDRLGRIERAEALLRQLGFVQFRVRHHEEVARLELDREGERRLAADPALRSEVVRAVRGTGFRFVVQDLEGYRGGSLALASTRPSTHSTGAAGGPVAPDDPAADRSG